MNDLTAFQRDLLYAITGLGNEPYGLAIKRKLETYYDGEINHGRLYTNLDKLVEKGLIEKGTVDRRTNSYDLSDEGERVIQARREWEAKHIDEVVAQPA